MTSFLRRENKAYRHVRAVNLGRFSLTGSDSGANYLRDIIDHPVSPEVKVQDRVEAKQATIALPITSNTLSISEEVTDLCRFKSCTEADGLSAILKSSHLQSLFSCHDAIAEKKFEPIPVKQEERKEEEEDFLDGISRASTSDSGVKSGEEEEEEEDGEMEDGVTIRMVGLRKSPYEPLGVTVRSENGVLVVARILGGGVVDRSGLLNVGDVVREVNGVEVFTPEQLAEVIKTTSDAINLKVEANFLDNGGGPQVMGGYDSMMHAVCYMRALFNYNPEEDTLLPCSEIGLAFHQGDVLEIVDQSDPNWWQARIVGIGGVGGPKGPAGLIPSQDLEERRKAFVKPEFDYVHKTGLCGTKISKKKKRHMYQTKAYSDFEKAELLMYEEVVRSPPFQRKTLVLIGAAGVGRRTLKNKLMTYDPSKFGAVIPFTSRPLRPGEEDGKSYHFSPRPEVESDITNHKYLEYGEFDGHIYGTKLDSIRSVIRSGRMCILDCSPAAVKLLHNSAEFRPYVVFIAAPGVDQLRFMHEYGRVMAGQSQRTLTMDRALRYSSRRARTMESLASFIEDEDLRRTMEESARLQRAYDKYIDVVVVNEDFDLTFQKVLDALDTLSTESQWVPVQWIY